MVNAIAYLPVIDMARKIFFFLFIPAIARICNSEIYYIPFDLFMFPHTPRRSINYNNEEKWALAVLIRVLCVCVRIYEPITLQAHD